MRTVKLKCKFCMSTIYLLLFYYYYFNLCIISVDTTYESEESDNDENSTNELFGLINSTINKNKK